MLKPDLKMTAAAWERRRGGETRARRAVDRYLGGGRAAWGLSATDLLKRLLAHARPERVFLPEAFCPSVVGMIRGLGLPIRFVPLLPGRWGWDVGAGSWGPGIALQAHLLGEPSEAPPRLPGLKVVEDCCHSGRPFNPDAHYRLFSVNDYKPVDLGGGGLLTTRRGWLPPSAEQGDDDTALMFVLSRHATLPQRREPGLRRMLGRFHAASGTRLVAWSDFKWALLADMLREGARARGRRVAASRRYRDVPGWVESEYAVIVEVDDAPSVERQLWSRFGFEYLRPFDGYRAAARRRLQGTLFLPIHGDWSPEEHAARKAALVECLSPRAHALESR